MHWLSEIWRQAIDGECVAPSASCVVASAVCVVRNAAACQGMAIHRLGVLKLILVRHGETDWNVEHRWLGHTDRPLNQHGIAQAAQAAAHLHQIDFVAAYTSDLRRAWETADVILKDRELRAQRCVALRERDNGEWEGLTDLEVQARFSCDYALWKIGRGEGAADAESYEALRARVSGAVRLICAEHPAGSILIVTHSGPIDVITALANGTRRAANLSDVAVMPHGAILPVRVPAGAAV